MIAVLQYCATADVAHNIGKASRLVSQAASQGAKFICLPEAFDYIVDPSLTPSPCAPQPLTGDRVTHFSSLAKELNVWISLGGIHEQAPNQKQYNTHVILDAKGMIRSTYRKIHLFDAMVEHGFKESNKTLAGHEVIMCKDTPVGNVGLTTCYDVRFPAMYEILREWSCDVILVPAAFTTATGEAGHWEVLLRARAIENQVYIVAAAQVGSHYAKRTSFGHSMVVDPFGRVLVNLKREPEGIGIAEVSTLELERVRSNMPVYLHREWDRRFKL